MTQSAKSTIYRHVPSRTDLMVAVLRHNMPDHDVVIPEGDLAESMTDPDWARMLPALLDDDIDPFATMHLLAGPLVLAAINDDLERLPALADEIVDRCLADVE